MSPVLTLELNMSICKILMNMNKACVDRMDTFPRCVEELLPGRHEAKTTPMNQAPAP